jgi:ferritin-like metal-binding protein YciE
MAKATENGKKEAKLTQYLTEAYAKEKELETALEAHIGMTTRAPYKKRLKEHLRETKSHSKQLERRIKQISGSGPALTAKAQKLIATAKGPLHAVRGGSEQEKMLKNAKTEYWNEHEEIATYTAIEVLATSVKDTETAKLARSIRRDEERMAKFLERQIGPLTKAVVQEEIPASERRASSNGSRRRSSTRSRSASNGSRRTSRSRSSSRRKSSSRS